MVNTRQGPLHFHPERIAWIGIGLLGASSLLALPSLWMLQSDESVSFIQREICEKTAEIVPYSFSLGLSAVYPSFPIPNLQEKMTFSFDPPRPSGATDAKRLLVRIKQTGESKRVVLPCRIDLAFQGDQLKFAAEPSLFWMDLAARPNGQIEAKGWISALDGANIDAGQFCIAAQDCPIQGAQEFPEGSPLHLLAEAKWWGKDLLRDPGKSGERIEMAELLEIQESGWLVWKEGKWQKSDEPASSELLARIQSLNPKMLVLEVWDPEGHTRIGLPLSVGLPFKMRGEDLLSAIRVRSEKQISCMLEKQCMVLKTGDWVLKTGNRWKLLRKKDERDAFLNGKLSGELFILEQIFQKQGQKVIQGRLFNPTRTQIVSIEMPVQTNRKRGARLP